MIPQRWRVLIGSALSLSFSIGTLLVYSFSLFVKPLASEFGWSRGEISLALSLSNLAVSVAAPIQGVLSDRLGSRGMILFGHCALCVGLSSLALLTPHLLLFYALFVFTGFFASACSPLPYARLISIWFDKDRGLGLGIMMAGIGLGSFVIPLIAQHAIAGDGWRTGPVDHAHVIDADRRRVVDHVLFHALMKLRGPLRMHGDRHPRKREHEGRGERLACGGWQ